MRRAAAHQTSHRAPPAVSYVSAPPGPRTPRTFANSPIQADSSVVIEELPEESVGQPSAVSASIPWESPIPDDDTRMLSSPSPPQASLDPFAANPTASSSSGLQDHAVATADMEAEDQLVQTLWEKSEKERLWARSQEQARGLYKKNKSAIESETDKALQRARVQGYLASTELEQEETDMTAYEFRTGTTGITATDQVLYDQHHAQLREDLAKGEDPEPPVLHPSILAPERERKRKADKEALRANIASRPRRSATFSAAAPEVIEPGGEQGQQAKAPPTPPPAPARAAKPPPPLPPAPPPGTWNTQPFTCWPAR